MLTVDSRRLGWFILIATAVIFLSGCIQPSGLSEVDRSVVRVLATDSGDVDGYYAGSGFVVAPGYVVTNHHVIAQGDRVSVMASEPSGNEIGTARVFWSSANYDLAILEVPELSRRGLRLSLADLSKAKGEQVLAIGFPGIADEIVLTLLGDSDVNDERLAHALGESTVSSGVLSRVIRRPWLSGTIDLKMIQHDAALHEGNSGGPLLNGCGQVIGVNTERAVPVMDEDRGRIRPAEGMSFAAHASELASVLQELNLPHRTTDRACRTQQGGMVALGLLLIGVLFALAWWVFLRGRSNAPLEAAAAAPPEGANGRTARLLDGETYAKPPVVSHRDRLPDWSVDWQGREAQGTLRLNRTRLASSEGCVLGRSDAVSDVVLEHETVSRRHCVLRQIGEQLEVMDLNSSNGTFVSGVRIKPFAWHPLDKGQAWQMGDVTLVMRCQEGD